MKKTTIPDRYEQVSAQVAAVMSAVEQHFGVSFDNMPEALELGPLPGDEIDIDQVLAEQRDQPLPTSSSPRRKASPSALTATSERICIRVPHYVLNAIRDEAEAREIKYQTVLNEILRDHVVSND